ncbi:VOC family protein, partial [Staphylococcus epidermidis]
KDILDGELLVSGRRRAYLSIGHTWIGVNEEKNIGRNEISDWYREIGLWIDEEDFEEWIECLKENEVNILQGRPREIKDKKWIYFR